MQMLEGTASFRMDGVIRLKKKMQDSPADGGAPSVGSERDTPEVPVGRSTLVPSVPSKPKLPRLRPSQWLGTIHYPQPLQPKTVNFVHDR